MSDRMPVVFVGHGSPMHALEDDRYSEGWKVMVADMPKPEAILAISAHWYTSGTFINAEVNPRQVFDAYGFPKEFYEISYRPSGSPVLALETCELLDREVQVDNSWGIDHGVWSVLHRMYPEVDVPVVQLSVDRRAAPEEHYRIGRQIASLRDEGVMILGSGDVVHNLGLVDWSMREGFTWADEFDDLVQDRIVGHRYLEVVDYRKLGPQARLAVPTPEHFYPLLYCLGAASPSDDVSVFNASCELGSISMTSYVFR